MAKLRLSLGDRSHDVFVGAGILTEAGRILAELGPSRRAAIVTDHNVAARHAPTLEQALTAHQFETRVLAIPPGEASKSTHHLTELWDAFADFGLERRDLVIALGGGVVGDLAGFAASTFRRGLPFVQVPTSLIAQVDSAIGGKTGINLTAGKNLAGTFWQPVSILVDPTVLGTLPDAELVAGLAEVVKYAVTFDRELFELLEGSTDELRDRNPALLAQIVRRSIERKIAVVEEDETETSGTRMLLNFGHTLGHVVEAASGYGRYRHGEAVSIGMICAARGAVARGLFEPAELRRLRSLLERIGLPVTPPAMPPDHVMGALRQDKKRIGGTVRFILPTTLGHARIEPLEDHEILATLRDEEPTG